MTGRLFLVTGITASGKTTVGHELAARLPRSVHIDGDWVQRFVVSGAVPMDLPAPAGALEQLRLRYAGALAAARVYRHAGFDTVVSDNIFEDDLPGVLDLAFADDEVAEVLVIVLCPSMDVVRGRYESRPGGGYTASVTVELLTAALQRTPHLGLWLDSSHQTPTETADDILERLGEAVVARSRGGLSDPARLATPLDEKEYLHRWLRMVRDVLVWKLEGLSDADVRRPRTRSGTTLLGLVKHITRGEIEYLGEAFGRPATDVLLPWWSPENAQKTMDTGADMYAAPGESTEYIVDLYRRACAHADQTIAERDLDDIGTVPHNGEVLLLRQALVHMIHETSRHAGHADIVRELIDGSIGGARDNPWVPDPADGPWWQEYLARVQASAAAAERAANEGA